MAYRGQRRQFGKKAPTRPEALASLRTLLASAKTLEHFTPAQLAHMYKVEVKAAEVELVLARQRREVPA